MENIEAIMETQELVEPRMIRITLDYWFANHDEVRSPFPAYMQDELPLIVVKKYVGWINGLSPEIKDTMKEELLMERLEEILFDEGYHLAQSDDDKITIRYPFMMRLGDQVMEKEKGGVNSKIIHREITKNGDEVFLKLTLEREGTGETWTTNFELPE